MNLVFLISKIIGILLLAVFTFIILRTNGAHPILCMLAEFCVVYTLGALLLIRELNKK